MSTASTPVPAAVSGSNPAPVQTGAGSDARTATLLVRCPDQKGLVAAITEFIHKNGGNILSLEQHVDTQAGEFFMRVQWSLAQFAIPDDKISEFFRVLIADRNRMQFDLYFSGERQRMAIFVSKLSHCLFDIMARVQSREWQVDVPLIVGNHPDLAGAAATFGIPFHFFEVKPDNKPEMERAQLKLLAEHKIDLVILARYMQIITPAFIAAYPQRIINIHHSFLPAFIGAKPHHRAYERGVKLIGATAHYVTQDLDEGPIIEQDVARVSHLDSVKDLVRNGLDVEKIVLARGIARHLDRKTIVHGNRVIVFS